MNSLKWQKNLLSGSIVQTVTGFKDYFSSAEQRESK
jgi:hypothetical protein